MKHVRDVFNTWVSFMFVAKGYTRYCGPVQMATHGKITVSGLPKHPSYHVTIIIRTQFTNVAAGHIIQSGRPHAASGPWVGDPWFSRISEKLYDAFSVLQWELLMMWNSGF